MNDQQNVIAYPTADKIDHYTIAWQDQRIKKVLMKAAPVLRPEDLAEEVREKRNITPVEITEMKTHDNSSHIRIYYLLKMKQT